MPPVAVEIVNGYYIQRYIHDFKGERYAPTAHPFSSAVHFEHAPNKERVEGEIHSLSVMYLGKGLAKG